MSRLRALIRSARVPAIVTGILLVVLTVHHYWITATIAGMLEKLAREAPDWTITENDLDLSGSLLASMRIDAFFTKGWIVAALVIFPACWGLAVLVARIGRREPFRWRVRTAMGLIALIAIALGAWNLWARSLFFQRQADWHAFKENECKEDEEAERKRTADYLRATRGHQEEYRRGMTDDLNELEADMKELAKKGKVTAEDRQRADEEKSEIAASIKRVEQEHARKDAEIVKKSNWEVADIARVTAWHARMKRLYRHAATRPWLTVSREPPPELRSPP